MGFDALDTVALEYVLHIIVKLLFDRDLGVHEDREPFNRFLQVFGKRAVDPLQLWRWTGLRGVDAEEQKKIIAPVHRFVQEAIGRARAQSAHRGGESHSRSAVAFVADVDAGVAVVVFLGDSPGAVVFVVVVAASIAVVVVVRVLVVAVEAAAAFVVFVVARDVATAAVVSVVFVMAPVTVSVVVVVFA